MVLPEYAATSLFYKKKGGAGMKTRFLKQFIFFLALICLITFNACSENRAAELFETAQFEELQNNKEHAWKLYKEIIARYPESNYADKASERITALKEKP
jgi:outer membrane protein assembly factor BamD (BamD/ComL family)